MYVLSLAHGFNRMLMYKFDVTFSLVKDSSFMRKEILLELYMSVINRLAASEPSYRGKGKNVHSHVFSRWMGIDLFKKFMWSQIHFPLISS